jgi:uncharacterized protein (DUF58 family)
MVPAAGATSGSSRGRFWRRTLWSFIYPRRAQQVTATASGVLLIVLALSIGIAAYNTSNNILFITLSLMLGCLILSGILSWANFAGLSWQLRAAPPFRVGQTATAALELHNHKRLLPTYGLWFEVRSASLPTGERLVLRDRLEAKGGETRLEWVFRPQQRGRERLSLNAVGSLFPFGFLRKVRHTQVSEDILVWPAPVAYQRQGVLAAIRPLSGEQVPRVGQGSDLLALRRYSTGDSHRLIHWKASARLRTLMVRQFTAETQEAFSLWVETNATLWPRPEQFELLCSFVTSLAEDLFTAGRLRSVAINEDPAAAIRRLRDLEVFFDRISLLQPESAVTPRSAPRPAGGGHVLRNLITFVPEGTRGVAALVDGQKTATA